MINLIPFISDYDEILIKDSYANIKEAEKAIEAYCIETNSQFSIYKAEAGFTSKDLYFGKFCYWATL